MFSTTARRGRLLRPAGGTPASSLLATVCGRARRAVAEGALRPVVPTVGRGTLPAFSARSASPPALRAFICPPRGRVRRSAAAT